MLIDFDLTDISVGSSEGIVDLTDFDSLSESDNNNGDVHVDDNKHTFSVITCSTVSLCVCSVLHHYMISY